MEINWADHYSGAITICDRKGIIVYMNDVSARQFEKDGGKKLVGANLLDCHPEPARKKLLAMLEKPLHNTYSVEKNGKTKIIHQSPWIENGVFKGVVELSFEIPTPMPHFVRK